MSRADVMPRPQPAPSLLEQVRGLIERTYDHRTGLGPLAPYVIGDEGLRLLTARGNAVERVRALAPPGRDGASLPPQLLVRFGPEGGVRASLYLPDRLIHTLERHPPDRALHAENVDAFAGLIEEIDHLLLLAARVRGGPPLTLLEMELHANVTKELVLRHYAARLAGLRALPSDVVEWIRYHLFRKPRFCDPDPLVRARYQDAARFGMRFLRLIDELHSFYLRLACLRRFSRMSHQQKIQLVQSAS